MEKIRKLVQNSLSILLCICVMAVFSMPASEAYAVSAPDKVSGITVSTVNCTTQKVRWKKIEGASGYQIYRGSKKVASRGYSARSCTVKKLSPGKKYSYKVRAYKKYYKKYYFKTKNGKTGKWVTEKPSKKYWKGKKTKRVAKYKYGKFSPVKSAVTETQSYVETERIDATYYEEGYVQSKCQRCGAVKTEKLKKLGMDFSKPENWYKLNDTESNYDKDKIDVFYILWTVVMKAEEDGEEVLCSTLSPQDIETMDGAFNYSKEIMFDSDHFNFYAPYYHQLTMSSYSQVGIDFYKAGLKAITDVCDAFDYYMEHQNNGRPFIIAGFSQGGLMTKAVLKHMTDEQYSRMVAAYSMGFQLTEKDLEDSHIRPAESADDLGTTISYNSVANTGAIWDQVAGESAACINPINWKTDDTPATFKMEYPEGTVDEGTVYVDQDRKVLIVGGGITPDKYKGQNYDGASYPMPEGNYHMWEMRFYADAIKDNAIHRAELFMDKQ